MNLTPGEKAVLAQILLLYKNAGERDQQLKALQMQWTPRPVVHAVVVEERRAMSQEPAPKVEDTREQEDAAKQVSARGAFSRLVLGLQGERT